MPELSRAYAREVTEILAKLPPGKKGNWGEMTSDNLTQHLIWAFKLSMGETPEMAFMGNFVLTTFIAPLVLNGWMKLPKNVKFKGNGNAAPPSVFSPGDLNTLKQEMERFMAGVEAGTLKTVPHPAFGDIGPKGWSKLHAVHLEHHLNQFGLRD